MTSIGADLGDQVRAGQVLVVLHSPALAQAQTAFLQANARRAVARRELDRARELLKDEAIQQKEVLRRQAEFDAATTEYGLAESSLHSLGWDHPQLDALLQKASRRGNRPVGPRRSHPHDSGRRRRPRHHARRRRRRARASRQAPLHRLRPLDRLGPARRARAGPPRPDRGRAGRHHERGVRRPQLRGPADAHRRRRGREAQDDQAPRGAAEPGSGC